jgi:hypothetical protein
LGVVGLRLEFSQGAVSQKRTSLLKNSSVPFLTPLQRLRTPVYGCSRPVWVVFEPVFGPPTNPTATFSTAWNVFDTVS